MLRQSADEDPHGVDFVELADAILGEDVHHARRQAAIRDDGQISGLRVGIELPLLEHDLRVPTEIAKMRAGLDGQPRHLEVEVVRQRAHDGVASAHQRQDGFAIADVERRRNQPSARIRGEKGRKTSDMEISETNLADGVVLQEIKGARRTL